LTELLHILASGLYGLAVFDGLWNRHRGQPATAVAWLVAAGAILHGIGFVALHAHDPIIPLESFPAALSLIGWLVPTSYLYSLRIAHVRGVGPWVAAAAMSFTLLAAIGLLLHEGVPRSQDVAGGHWSHAHVLLSTLGFSLLALTSMAGLAYLTKKRALKQNQASRFGLPSLESLDRMEHVTLGLGFSLLSLGVLTGFVWGMSRGVSPWTQHSSWLIVAWAVYLVPIGMRLVRQQHGDRPARVVVAGFGFLAFSYIGIRLLGMGA